MYASYTTIIRSRMQHNITRDTRKSPQSITRMPLSYIPAITKVNIINRDLPSEARRKRRVSLKVK